MSHMLLNIEKRVSQMKKARETEIVKRTFGVLNRFCHPLMILRAVPQLVECKKVDHNTQSKAFLQHTCKYVGYA